MSLFNGADQAPKFEDLVGEGKKFNSPDELAKAKIEADNFVEQLKRETAELRKELTARPAVDRSQEILDQLEALRTTPTTERLVTNEPERVEVKGLSVEDVEKLIEQREARKRADANINLVKAKLQETFGDNYGAALNQLAAKNGLSNADLDDLAARSPQLVLSLLGQTKSERPFTPPSSSVQTTSKFEPTAGGHKPRSWWNELKARDKNLYFSQEMGMRQYRDAMALGESFEDV